MSVIVFHVVEDHGEDLETDEDAQEDEGRLQEGEVRRVAGGKGKLEQK